ncbi:MAG: glycosyltransferase [Bacteroidaceae bacterium]|nr:glycosyltransferase [Bacteroidaceae bacterium]
MNIVIMVSEGYPLRFSANNTKSRYVALGLKEAGCTVAMCDSIIGTKGISHSQEGISNDGIVYKILPRKGFAHSCFSNIGRIWRFLKQQKKKGEKNHLIMGTDMFPFFIITILMAALLGYSRSVLFHEWFCAIKMKSRIKWLQYYLTCHHFGYFINAIFPISHFLEEKSQKFHKPKMLLPVLGDFSQEVAKPTERCSSFAYCCGAGFLMRNTFVVDAFIQMKRQHPKADCKLILVVVGNKFQIKQCQEYLEGLQMEDEILLKYQIPFEELKRIYETSIALIAPLDPTNVQDEARFSQKIAEYVSTGRPIITNNVGEIPYYFENRKSACVVPYTTEGFAQAMEDMWNDPVKATSIGQEGYQIGLNYFDYKKVGQEVKDFIDTIK